MLGQVLRWQMATALPSKGSAAGGPTTLGPHPRHSLLYGQSHHPYGLCASSNFRPALDTKRKSRLLSSCLRSVLALPLTDVLEKHLCLFMEPPNIQVSQGDQEDGGGGV